MLCSTFGIFFCSFVFMTILRWSDNAVLPVMQHFWHQTYAVQGVLDFGQSSRLQSRPEALILTGIAMLPPSGSCRLGKIYTADTQKLNQLLFIDCPSTHHFAAKTTLCIRMHAISKIEIDKRLLSWNAFVLLKTVYLILFSDVTNFCLHK